jgi:hypothetical protein
MYCRLADGMVCRIDRSIEKSNRYASDFSAIPWNYMDLANFHCDKREQL